MLNNKIKIYDIDYRLLKLNFIYMIKELYN